MAGKKKAFAGQKTERGVCILCGGEKEGVPARADAAISLARRLRGALGTAGRHTVACENCYPMCAAKRQAFEKRMRDYRLYAALFFVLLLGGSAAYGHFSLWLALPGALGSAIILLLPFGRYFPAFPEK